MGLNDPQWGNKNSGGPPDLEEVMRNLNRKIESLFGRSGGGAPKGGDGKVGGGMGGIGLIALVALETHQTFIFPSLGATAFILFHLPLAEAASPRNVLCAHLLGAICGWLCLALFGLRDEPFSEVREGHFPDEEHSFRNTNMRLVASFPLTYSRGFARVQRVITSPGERMVPLEWLPWRDGTNDLVDRQAEMSLYPQPILSDIEFTLTGDMVIGLRDRHGDMTVARQVMSNNNTVLEKPGLAVGDTLIARYNGSTWDAETPDAVTEHFYDRSTDLGDENLLGALARITGFDLVVASSLRRGAANFGTTSYGLDETAIWYVGESGARRSFEAPLKRSGAAPTRSRAQPAGRPERGRPPTPFLGKPRSGRQADM